MTISRYNIEWPDGTPDATIELGAYRASLDGANTGLPPWEHMFNAACLLFTEKQYARHYWVKRRMRCWCEHGFQTWIGPGSVAKSTDAGVCCLLHWLSAPFATTVIVCSTTQDMLDKRIFGEIVRYYKLIPDAPGMYRTSEGSITLGDENSKNGIFGVAVLRGTVKEALGNMVGIHNTYNVLIIDEMQATRPAAVEASVNLSASGKEFKFLGMGNPESRLDPLGRYSTPLSGWDSINPDRDEKWKTRYGMCEFFDGYKSPAIVEPNGKKKYPFLLGTQEMDELARWYGKDPPQFWSQRRGFFPPEGLENTLFSESFFIKNLASIPAVWRDSFTDVAALDPAFSSGGDRCQLVFARVGYDHTLSKMLVEFTDNQTIKLESSDADPIAYQIARVVKTECGRRGITPDCFALDTSGTQTALADVLDTEWSAKVSTSGARVLRVSFGGAASDRRPAVDSPSVGRDMYANRVTELWNVFHSFVRHGHVRGLSTEAVTEFCTRLLKPQLKPACVESKRDMKKRLGKSPDIADAHAILTALLRERLGVVPGQVGPGTEEGEAGTDSWSELASYDLDAGNRYAVGLDAALSMSTDQGGYR